MVGLLGAEIDWRSVSGRVVSVLVTYVEDELVSRRASVYFVYIDDGLTRSTPFFQARLGAFPGYQSGERSSSHIRRNRIMCV
jgi:hypothetical protein